MRRRGRRKKEKEEEKAEEGHEEKKQQKQQVPLTDHLLYAGLCGESCCSLPPPVSNVPLSFLIRLREGETKAQGQVKALSHAAP